MNKLTFVLGLSLILVVAGAGFVVLTSSHERELERQRFSYEMQLSQKDAQIRLGLQPYIASFVNGKSQTPQEHTQIVKWLSHLPKSDIREVQAAIVENIPLKILCDEVVRYQDSLQTSMN